MLPLLDGYFLRLENFRICNYDGIILVQNTLCNTEFGNLYLDLIFNFTNLRKVKETIHNVATFVFLLKISTDI